MNLKPLTWLDLLNYVLKMEPSDREMTIPLYHTNVGEYDRVALLETDDDDIMGDGTLFLATIGEEN